jgi:hypothetical protein
MAESESIQPAPWHFIEGKPVLEFEARTISLRRYQAAAMIYPSALALDRRTVCSRESFSGDIPE